MSTENYTEINGNNDLGLGAKHHTLLGQFKELIGDVLKPGYVYHTDAQLIKFCVARNWDLKKAEVMFRNAMSLREKLRLDHILEEYKPPEMIVKHVTGGIAGFDLEGCPVRYERFGLLDTKGIYYSFKKADLEKFKLWEQEHAQELMRKQTEQLGRPINRLTVVMDLNEINSKQLWRPGLQLYLHLVKVLEDNYPEFTKHLIVVNAPRIFPIFFKVCRPLISEGMRRKLRVFGSEFKSELLSIISEDQLPAFLGGKMTGPGGDIYCKDKIRMGGPVPESLYLKDSIDTSQFETASISAGSKLVIKIPIDQPYCAINWEFMTKDKDIAFSLSVIPEGSDKSVTLLPSRRVQCHMVPEDGSYTCDQLGTYVVKFDNSYSWSKGKKLLYNIEAFVEDEDLVDEVNELTAGDQFS